jgi:hypothetical protein
MVPPAAVNSSIIIYILSREMQFILAIGKNCDKIAQVLRSEKG